MVVSNYRDDAPYYRELGQVIGQEKKVVIMAGDYGYRLEYWGWINGTYWLSAMDTNLRQLAGQAPRDFALEFAEKTADADLFVITSQAELDKQPELRDYLAEHYPVFTRGEGYLIYDLRP
jgi:hypothetical protein